MVDNFNPHSNSGRVTGLAVTSKTRSELVPDIPTVSESGLPAVTWTFVGKLISDVGIKVG